jgi:hypothetical protein
MASGIMGRGELGVLPEVVVLLFAKKPVEDFGKIRWK